MGQTGGCDWNWARRGEFTSEEKHKLGKQKAESRNRRAANGQSVTVIRRRYECAALLGFCDREGHCAQVNPVVLDPAVGRILPRQIAQARNPLLAPEVEHELVRMRRLGGLPLG